MITIKPHHFIDIVAAYGDGQTRFEPHPFGHAVHSVAHQILADPATELRMELGADDICAPCRHNEDGQCQDTIDTSFRPGAPTSKREWNLRIDERWCERLGLAQGDRLTAREFCEHLATSTGSVNGSTGSVDGSMGSIDGSMGSIDGSMGSIDDIYREVPRAMTADRLRRVRAGVALFLGR